MFKLGGTSCGSSCSIRPGRLRMKDAQGQPRQTFRSGRVRRQGATGAGWRGVVAPARAPRAEAQLGWALPGGDQPSPGSASPQAGRWRRAYRSSVPGLHARRALGGLPGNGGAGDGATSSDESGRRMQLIITRSPRHASEPRTWNAAYASCFCRGFNFGSYGLAAAARDAIVATSHSTLDGSALRAIRRASTLLVPERAGCSDAAIRRCAGAWNLTTSLWLPRWRSRIRAQLLTDEGEDQPAHSPARWRAWNHSRRGAIALVAPFI